MLCRLPLVALPRLYPLDNARHVRLHVVRGLALQLDDDFWWVRVARFLEHGLHDLGLVVLLDLLEGVISGDVLSTEGGRKGARAVRRGR